MSLVPRWETLSAHPARSWHPLVLVSWSGWAMRFLTWLIMFLQHVALCKESEWREKKCSRKKYLQSNMHLWQALLCLKYASSRPCLWMSCIVGIQADHVRPSACTWGVHWVMWAMFGLSLGIPTPQFWGLEGRRALSPDHPGRLREVEGCRKSLTAGDGG